MARIRSIHPSLWTDENFVGLSPSARLFMIGLWNEADDFGVFAWKPTTLKMRLAPADAIDAITMLSEIEDGGFVTRVVRGGREFGVVKNFLDFQRPKNPSAPLVEIDDEIREIVGPHSSSHKQGIPKRGGMATPDLPQPAGSDGEALPKLRGQMEDGGDNRKGEEDPSVVDPAIPRASVADGDAALAFHERVLALAGIDVAKDIRGKWLSSEEQRVSASWLAELPPEEAERIIAEKSARRKNGPPSTLRYFDGAIRDAVERKRVGLPPSGGRPPPPSVFGDGPERS